MHRRPLSAVATRPASAPEAPAGGALKLLGCLWFVVLFAPQWWLAGHGIRAALRIQTLLFVVLGVVLAVGVPLLAKWSRQWTWYAPLLAFVATGLFALPFATNRGLAFENVQIGFLMWTFVVATALLVDTPRRAERLLLLYGLHFLVLGLAGVSSGRIVWHTVLSNYDGYGAFAVLGIGLCSFISLAATGLYRWLMFVAVAVCGIGVVSSFARGAFLAAAAVFAVVWLRSPRKGRMLGIGLVGVAVMIGAAEILHPGTFWAEMQSVFSQGTDEGTGADRWDLWQAGFQVFLKRPVFGVGPGNFGAFAAGHFRPGEIGGFYSDNPGRLYGRSPHSSYVQILSEQGLAGVAAFVWLMIDFWRRNAQLRMDRLQPYWAAMGGRLQLSYIALGLEAAMTGWLATAAVYSMAGTNWLYAIIALNLAFHRIAWSSANRHHSSHATVPHGRPSPTGPGAGHRNAKAGQSPTYGSALGARQYRQRPREHDV